MRLLPAGDRAALIELPDNDTVQRLALVVREHFGSRVQDVVPGHQTLLVSWPAGGDARAIKHELAGLEPGAAARSDELPEVLIPVRYDGPDIRSVAQAAGVSVDELAQIHAQGVYTAAFIGFAPGFAYLIGADERLSVPRRSTPRVKVPAGAVAVAGEYSAIYPSEGPGGWQLIGHTDAVLFDLEHEPPAMITPGTRVRFEAV